jgi:hypothetical protein
LLQPGIEQRIGGIFRALVRRQRLEEGERAALVAVRSASEATTSAVWIALPGWLASARPVLAALAGSR